MEYYDDDIHPAWEWFKLVLKIAAVICALLLCDLLFGACASKRMAPVAEHRLTEYIYKRDTVNRIDSVWQHDSVFVTQYQKGDTVYLDKVRWQWRDRIKTEYVKVESGENRADTVVVTQYVEKPLTNAQKRLLRAGKVLYGIVALAVLFLAVWGGFRIKRIVSS